ncbi:MAG: DUF167 domain-containing protein [Nitrospiraceae bacterium]
MKPSPVQDAPDGAVLIVHVQPRASRTEYAGRYGEACKIRVSAPPIEGAANEALRDFLAKQFDIPRSAVILCSGAVSRQKRVMLKGISARRVEEKWKLASLLGKETR